MSYVYKETKGADGGPLLFTFHGTGGDESQFHGLGEQILPDAHVVSPRGDVSENGANRYFRRTGEGVYDMPDLAARTQAMAGFVRGFPTGDRPVIGLGYSNGANILASVAMAEPGLFTDIVLMHPLIPWVPDPVPALKRVNVLIPAGRRDPICSPAGTDFLADWFREQGADTTLYWHEGGHEIPQAEIQTAAEFVQSAENRWRRLHSL